MAIAPSLLQTGRGFAGSAYLTGGMSSGVDPVFLDDRAYRYAENTINRGGRVRTRPGYNSVFRLPAGELQGLAYFRPIQGEGQLLAFAHGIGYVGRHPIAYENWAQITGLAHHPHASVVYHTTAVQSAVRNADGTITAVPPRKVLISQCGHSRACIWDGESVETSDPTVVTNADGQVLTAGIPIGGPLCFSGGRLWQASRNRLFASDIDNPLSFVENQYLGEGGYFVFDDDITALAELPSSDTPVLLVFTNTRTYALQSGLRDRASWKTTKDFQATFLPDIGCVGSRGVIAQQGELFWMSHLGLISLNAARSSRLDSRLAPQDTELAVSKSRLAADKSRVALGTYENYMLVSVPYADKYNAHTWVRDFAAVSAAGEQPVPAWASVWTGTRPVEWATGLFAGSTRCYFASKDYDGVNRIWEAFTQSQQDNDQPITCVFESKTHIDFSGGATGLDRKQIKYAEVFFTDLLGEANVQVYYAGVRGKYKQLAEAKLVATTGSLQSREKIAGEVSEYRGQSRVVRTREASQLNGDCTSQGVESTLRDHVDFGFSLLIRWTGRLAVQAYRIAADPHQDPPFGQENLTETGPKVLSGAVCGE